MAKLDEVLQTENSFYSIRSDDSILLVLKVRETFATSIWMLIRTDTQKQAQSDHWAFSKIGDKETVSFPVVSTGELKRIAHEGDFLEWQKGFAAPYQSESDLLLNEREQALEKRIRSTEREFEKKEQVFQEKIQKFFAEVEERERTIIAGQGTRIKDGEEVFDKREHTLEERMQTLLSDLDKQQRKTQSEHDSVLSDIREGSEQIKGEAKYFQVVLKEKRDTSIAEIDQRVISAQSLVETLQRSLDEKEQLLNSLVETKTHLIEEKVKTLQTDLAEQKPLSAEKYRQDAARKAYWLSLWLVIAGVVFFALILIAALLPGANTVLIDTFGSVAAILAILTSGITFFLRTRNA